MPPRMRPTSSGQVGASNKRGRPTDPRRRSAGGGQDGRTQNLQRNPDADPVRIRLTSPSDFRRIYLACPGRTRANIEPVLGVMSKEVGRV